LNGSQKELYQKAQKLEKKTRDFYREKSVEVGREQKEVLLKIAEEEQKHYDILENLIMMLQRPEGLLPASVVKRELHATTAENVAAPDSSAADSTAVAQSAGS
jgi:rubrerythrin